MAEFQYEFLTQRELDKVHFHFHNDWTFWLVPNQELDDILQFARNVTDWEELNKLLRLGFVEECSHLEPMKTVLGMRSIETKREFKAFKLTKLGFDFFHQSMSTQYKN